MAGPITEDPEVDTDVLTETKSKEEVDHPWNVVVFDDPVNYMGFVTLILRRVFGYSEQKAEEMMMEVHTAGKSIVWSGVREKAEFYVQQLQSYQLRARLEKSGGDE